MESTEIHDIDKIKELVESSNTFVLDCLLTVYDKQTEDEKMTEDTKHNNSVGFSGADGFILTSFSKQIIEWRNTPEEQRKYKFPLSQKQLDMARRKIVKYTKQLAIFLPPDFDFKKYSKDKTQPARKKEITIEDVKKSITLELAEYVKEKAKYRDIPIENTRQVYNLVQVIAALPIELRLEHNDSHYVVMFGKHRDEMLIDLPPGYLMWAVSKLKEEMEGLK